MAHVFAQAGIEVNLVDLNETVLEHAMDLMKANLETLAEFQKISGDDIPEILSRIHPYTDLAGGAEGVDFCSRGGG